MYIHQAQIKNLRELAIPGKVVIIYGPRRVGKTTLLHKFLEEVKEPHMFVNGDDIIAAEYLESQSIAKLRDFIGNNKWLIIDEAQYINKIGLNLKLVVDHVPDVRIIATGSSSFEFAKDDGAPLTGRKFVLKLFPLAQMEISQVETLNETKANLESRLIFGSYPEVVTNNNNSYREEYLHEIVSSYLFKDILELNGVRKSDKLPSLLQLLAFQIGKDVSFNELGTKLGMNKNTVERYLDLLEQVFVIFKRSGFSRNLRKEITKTKRYYFIDNGIRNALINNFNPLSIRNDVGELWENYIVNERMKKQEYLRKTTYSYFWRTYDKKEVDLVEERDGKLFGYEIKWGKKTKRIPTDWKGTYPEAEYMIINRENYLDFIK
ncbi:ATP-binding protein [bacterium]|nr:ATP-binding protein [bacterium]